MAFWMFGDVRLAPDYEPPIPIEGEYTAQNGLATEGTDLLDEIDDD